MYLCQTSLMMECVPACTETRLEWVCGALSHVLLTLRTSRHERQELFSRKHAAFAVILAWRTRISAWNMSSMIIYTTKSLRSKNRVYWQGFHQSGEVIVLGGAAYWDLKFDLKKFGLWRQPSILSGWNKESCRDPCISLDTRGGLTTGTYLHSLDEPCDLW